MFVCSDTDFCEERREAGHVGVGRATEGDHVMINQLRLYDYDPALEEPFLSRFRDHAARIMARYGFRILAMWTTRTEAASLRLSPFLAERSRNA